jgi:ribosomal protein S18 acetylase RimI-like enzyme
VPPSRQLEAPSIGPMAVTIREARADDAASIAALLTELGYPTEENRARTRLERLQAEPTTKVLVAEAEEGGDVVGVSAIRAEALLEHDRPAARLLALVVAKDYRRRGVASALVEAAEAQAQALGCFRIVLTSADHRDDARRFYLTAGYEQTGRRFAKELAPIP